MGVVIGVAVVRRRARAASRRRRRAAKPDQVKARQKIFMMEGVLERAVQIGVDSLLPRVRAVMPPDALLLSGAPQVRGFRLEGYGVFFDVEVPALRRRMAWSLRTMNENGLGALPRTSLKAYIADGSRIRAQRAEFERACAASSSRSAASARSVPTVRSQQAASARTVGASTVAASATVAPGRRAPPVDPPLLEDPSDAYTREVKAALIDAMIENSGPLAIGADEWLTVAARDNVPADRLVPGDILERQHASCFRIKGSDLAAYPRRDASRSRRRGRRSRSAQF